jgi:hypothetical protein
MPDQPRCLRKPTPADCAAVRAISQARAALRQVTTRADQDGDFCFVMDRRLQTMAGDLSAMEAVFRDLYGGDEWARAVSA